MNQTRFNLQRAAAAKAKVYTLFLAASLMNPWFSQAQTATSASLPSALQLVQTVEGITEYQLANGLRILLAPDAGNDRVTVNMTYMVGSRHEGYGETGMAHLLEHLIFKGSPKTPNPKGEFGRRGFTFNGTTSVDRTNYFATFETSQPSLDWYLGWQADAMINSFIARKDLDSEMTVVRNEYEQAQSNPVQVLIERVKASAYIWHNYGKATLGAKSDIENVDIAKLQSFYRRFYRPDNAVITIAGKFDAAATLASIALHFGKLAIPDGPIPNTYTLDAAQDGERSVVLRRPAATQMIINGYHTPPVLHRDSIPLALLNLVLTAPPSGRLNKALVETQQAKSVFGAPHNFREAGLMMYGAEIGVSDTGQLQTKILQDTVEGVGQRSVTQEEFDRAKIALVKGFEYIMSKSDFIAASVAESAALGDWRNLFFARDRVASVTLDDVNRVAKTYFVASNRTSGHLIPTPMPVRSPEPKPLDVAAHMAGAEFKAQGDTLVEFDYSFANLQKTGQMSTLAQGIKLGVLSKPVRGDVVTVRFQLRFGELTSLANRQAAGSITASMIDRGTDQYTRQQIQDKLAGLGAFTNFVGGPQGAEGSIVVKKQNLPETLKLFVHLLKSPNFPSQEFEEVKFGLIKTVEGQLLDPSSQANVEFNRHSSPYNPGDARYAYTSQEWLDQLKAVTRQQVVDFHTQFYGAQFAEVVVLGPVDAQEVSKQVANLLENWRAPMVWERVPFPYFKKTPTRLVYDTPDKSNAALRARLQLELGDKEVQRWPLELASRMFGVGSGSRLGKRLREQLGLSYSVGSRYNQSRHERMAIWSIDADVSPSNLAQAETSIRQELASSLANGFTAQEFENAKRQWLAERRRGRSGDEHAMTMMRAVQEFDQDWDLPLKNDALIANLTLEQVNSAWRKYISPDDLVWGVFSDAVKRP